MAGALLGAILGGLAISTIGTALAEEPVRITSSPSVHLMCRVFEVDTAFGATIETADRTSEVGQWIGEQEDVGWRFHTIDFEVGQKHTGYPQGYVQVCLSGP